ncbi:hypothetical protein Lesp02_18190 [Lentzea sp. NBRC 105346]|nr:hypothetical protein Lesp02_18190 [Lentzea sp. NBRC 105346]
MNEWTPEAIKAEIDYRREDALRHRGYTSLRSSRQPSWWHRVTHRIPEPRKADRDAA